MSPLGLGRPALVALVALELAGAPLAAQVSDASDPRLPGSWRAIPELRVSPDLTPTAAERTAARALSDRLRTLLRAAAPDDRLRGVEARFRNWLADLADADSLWRRGPLMLSVELPFHEKYFDDAGSPVTAMEPGAGITVLVNDPRHFLFATYVSPTGERYYNHTRDQPRTHGVAAYEASNFRFWPVHVITRPGRPPVTLPVSRAEYVVAMIHELEREGGRVGDDFARGIKDLEKELAGARARGDATAAQAIGEALREIRKAAAEQRGGGVAADGVAQLRRELAAMSPLERARPAYVEITAGVDPGDDAETKGRVMSRLVDDPKNGVAVVRINPAFWDRSLPRTTPQLITVEFSRRHDRVSDVSDVNMHRALNEVEAALDWAALRAIVAGGPPR